MMKFLLSAVAGLATVASSAQCIPNPLYVDSVFGVWPDTTENFANGEVGLFYSDTLNLIVPLNAQDIDPGFPAVQLDSVQFDGVDGLPPGLGINCNSQTPAPCTYLTGVLGCGLIEGTPTTAGSYPLVLNVTAYTALFGSPVPFPYSFSGYEITIAPSTGIIAINGPGLAEVRNSPNPFSSRTTIEFDLKRAGATRVAVFNLVGEELWSSVQDGVPGHNKVMFDGSGLDEGVYLFKVDAAGQAFTGRMVLNR